MEANQAVGQQTARRAQNYIRKVEIGGWQGQMAEYGAVSSHQGAFTEGVDQRQSIPFHCAVFKRRPLSKW